MHLKRSPLPQQIGDLTGSIRTAESLTGGISSNQAPIDVTAQNKAVLVPQEVQMFVSCILYIQLIT